MLGDMRLQAAQLSWQPGMEGGSDPMSRFTAHDAGWTGSVGMPNQQRGTNKYESPPGLSVLSGSPNPQSWGYNVEGQQIKVI